MRSRGFLVLVASALASEAAASIVDRSRRALRVAACRASRNSSRHATRGLCIREKGSGDKNRQHELEKRNPSSLRGIQEPGPKAL